MTNSPFEQFGQVERDLWAAADNLRANSKLASSEYFMPVLGIIFLRHAHNRFLTAEKQIQDDIKAGRMPKRKPIPQDFLKRGSLWLPEESRWPFIVAPSGKPHQDLGKVLKSAMEAIEREYPPLKGVLPKDYGVFERDPLDDLLRVFNREILNNASGDVFGRINEYFLMEFANAKAYDNGEFFTPPSIVQTIVNVIEPDHGKVFDPACGSCGMFVQTSHFIKRLGMDTAKRVEFYGQEKTATTIKIANMNLAVHGLVGDVREANTFYQDEHNLVGKCDFVMANPPFNVDMVDAGKLDKDPRLPFGLPGVNKEKKVSNGNYLWISYFWSYLNKTGRSGFVMSSQASSAGHSERDVRKKIVETGDVDVMISIRSNFFYTRSVPCELWFFDRGKPKERRDKVLMLDARNVYRKVTRKINDFSPEQLQNLTAIVWLYRGQTDRFIDLVQTYLDRTIAEVSHIPENLRAFRKAYENLVNATKSYEKSLPKDSPLRAAVKERDDAANACFEAFDRLTSRIAKDWKKPSEWKSAAQRKRSAELDELGQACRDLSKQIELVCKLSTRLVDSAEKDFGARDCENWDARAVGRFRKDLEAKRIGFDETNSDGQVTRQKGLIEILKLVAYFERQAHWLISRFPDAKFVPVLGLCKVVTPAEIRAADWSLTPGRYVGVAAVEEDEDFDFEQTLTDIHVELEDLNKEAVSLATKIQKNIEELRV